MQSKLVVGGVCSEPIRNGPEVAPTQYGGTAKVQVSSTPSGLLDEFATIDFTNAITVSHDPHKFPPLTKRLNIELAFSSILNAHIQSACYLVAALTATSLPSLTMLSALGNPRQAAAQILNFGLILSTAFMMWKGLSVIADSPSPIVVVLSGSMEPAFQRGDLLFLWNRNLLEDTKVGEIVVYNVKGKDIPIVHRLVRKFGTGEGAKLLTKGDNNVADDTELYARGQDYIERKDIIGSVVAYIPLVGYVTIMLSEHPWLKTVMLGIMGLVVVLQRE
ncbi:hypothetical protein HYALB_00012121 [Hymenoscyphus albidus]|uniref:Signal peptidase complex catalytic subunit SEC11 n=1 Tax=Hymenoscyphus albidus TaxID=595503 RepID=A0A9N9Q5N7_9HELO|nr:hypothetical protein HYALB_00012121 [Hymenoscyphus albidus]